MSKSNSKNGLSLTFVVFLIFLVLKLTNNIDWSWWWVTSPLWIPVALSIAILFMIFTGVLIALSFGTTADEIKDKLDFYKEKFKKD